MDVTLPSGFIIQGVPDDASKEEVKSKAISAGLATEQDFIQQTAPTGQPESEKVYLDEDQVIITGEEVEPQPDPEFTTGEQLIGAAETGATMATGSTTGIAGMVGGTLSQLAKELVSGEFGTKEAAQRIQEEAQRVSEMFTYAPKTEAGQEQVKEVGEFMAPAQALTGLAPQIQAAASMARPAAVIKPVAKEAARVKQTVPAVKQLVKRDQVLPSGEVAPITQSKIVDRLRFEPYNPSNAKVRLIGGEVVTDKLGNQAIKQGFREGSVAVVKASGTQDKKNMLKMLNIHELGRKSDVFRAKNRPADIIGESFNKRIKFISDLKKEGVKELESVANQKLKNQSVDYSPAINNFVSKLNEMGVTLTETKKGIKVALRGSDLEGDKTSQAMLTRAFNRLYDTDVNSAYDVHRAKKWIDTQIDFGKRSKNGLSGQTEIVLKKLRRDLNESLKNEFPEYAKANKKLEDSFNAFDQLGRAIGKNVDLDNPNIDKLLGQESRKLLSNYRSRIEMMNTISDLDDLAKKYGFKVDDDLLNQVSFANELDRMFGSPADTSLKGQVATAMETGVKAARGSAKEAAFDLVSRGLEKARGINEENAITAMKDLINRELKESNQ